MQLAKLITPKKINTLYKYRPAFWQGFILLVFALTGVASLPVSAQDNSPYSRYGIGDLVPQTSITGRGMGHISAGYTNYLAINFNNPASFSSFETRPDAKSRKISSGRAVLDVGMDFESRSLQQSSPAGKFKASNALFSYVQVGIPIKTNWGIVFGLRPISRISYKIFHDERLKDPITGQPIDSATTRYEGDGGSYLASLGTGIVVYKKDRGNGIEEKLSAGLNVGYFFGKKDYSTRRTLINDTVDYYSANFRTKTSFGNIYMNAGFQYQVPIVNQAGGRIITLTAGAYGSWNQKLNASQDRIRETFIYDPTYGELRLDSISDQTDIKGKILMPSSFTIGAVIQKFPVYKKESGWLVGIDFATQNWDSYRFYGEKDSLRNKWEIRMGAQFSPIPKTNYFSNVAYRLGFFTGPDYIRLQQKLPQLGFTFGLGLPIPNENRLSPYQASIVNLSFEFIKRGNNNNLLKENLFRLSLGLSLSDVWFIKKKYD